MIVIDATDPTKPFLAAEMERNSTAVSFAVFDSSLFCSAKGALEIYELSALPMLETVSVLEGTVGGCTLIFDRSGKHIFLSAWDKGFDVVDFSDPTKPLHISSCGCEYHSDYDEWSDRSGVKPYGITQMEKHGNFLIAVAMDYNIHKHREALYVYDVHKPERPEIFARISTAPIRTHAMAVSGDYAYAGGYEKILSININHPEEPEIVGEIELKGVCANYFFSREDRLYVSGRLLSSPDGDCFIGVIDVSNPVHPKLIGGTVLPTAAGYEITLREDIAYIACAGGLGIVSFRNPERPELLSVFPITRPGVEFWGIEVFHL